MKYFGLLTMCHDNNFNLYICMTSQVLGLGLAGHGLGLGLMGHILDSITADHIIRSPVSCADDEHVLLAAHSVHFGKELIYDPVRSATSVTDTATS